MLNGGSIVAEHLGDADLVQGDISWAESCEPIVAVAAEPGCTGLRLADQFAGGGSIAVNRSGVGGNFEEGSVHGKLSGAGRALGLDIAHRGQ